MGNFTGPSGWEADFPTGGKRRPRALTEPGVFFVSDISGTRPHQTLRGYELDAVVTTPGLRGSGLIALEDHPLGLDDETAGEAEDQAQWPAGHAFCLKTTRRV